MAGSFVIDGHLSELTELMGKRCQVQQSGSFSEHIKRTSAVELFYLLTSEVKINLIPKRI